MSREIIIAALRKQLADMKGVCSSIEKMKKRISGIIEELEDESRLGTQTEYDFGSGAMKKYWKDMEEDLKNDIKALNSITETLSEIQGNTKRETPEKNYFED